MANDCMTMASPSDFDDGDTVKMKTLAPSHCDKESANVGKTVSAVDHALPSAK